jgi:hypothetical protein
MRRRSSYPVDPVDQCVQDREHDDAEQNGYDVHAENGRALAVKAAYRTAP